MTRNAYGGMGSSPRCEGAIRPTATKRRLAPASITGPAPVFRRLLLVGALCALALTTTAVPGSGAPPSEVNITVEMGDYWFSPSYLAVEVNSTLNITLRNTAGQLHEFEVLGYGVEGAAEGFGNGSLVFVANKTGTFTILCGVPGHSTQGMVGRLIVVGPGFELNPLPQVAGQMIAVLEAVAEEYKAANVTGGAPQNPTEYNESRDFLEAAKDLWSSIEADASAHDPKGAAKVGGYLSNLTAKIAGYAPDEEVHLLVADLKEELLEIGAATTTGASSGWQEHLAALRAGLAQVAALYRAGDAAGADTLLGEVYLSHVEPLEKALENVDPALKTRMESEIIVELRGLMRGAAGSAAVDAEIAKINATLDQVAAKLAPPSAPAGPWFVLGAVAGLIAGTVLGTLAFALYVRKLAAASRRPQGAETAPETKGGGA